VGVLEDDEGIGEEELLSVALDARTDNASRTHWLSPGTGMQYLQVVVHQKCARTTTERVHA
jgi:hypothetical protein